MKNKLFVLLVLALFATLNAQLSTVFAQGTAFTYQGRVLDNGTNFSGAGQFKFALVTSTNTSSQATAKANLTGQFVTSITLVNGGNGYVTTPAVTISGGGGSGATATAMISGGVVTNIAINNAGSGYTSTPTVAVAPPPQNITYTTYWSNDGTSVNGSEPAAAVSVGVVNGLFTVVLGDATVANMTSIDASLFAQPNLQLRIWFNDGVNGSVVLNPVQNLTPAPYAVFAQASSNLVGVIASGGLAGAYSRAVTFNNPGDSFTGAFTGNGAGVTNVNAATLGGLGANQLWHLNGNAGTTPGVNFIGTTDNQPLELWVNNTRSLRIEPNTNSAPNLIGGAPGNTIDPGVFGSTIGGGGGRSGNGLTGNNRVSSEFCTIAGGTVNTIQTNSFGATISGGNDNTIGGGGSDGATIAGGEENKATASLATVSGGLGNTASGVGSFVAGGGIVGVLSQGAYYVAANQASGMSAAVPGGAGNTAAGKFSFAVGYRAKANHDGSFAWGDATESDLLTTANNQFLIRASGGVGIGTSSPATQLHVASANQTVAIIDGSYTGGTWLGLGNSSVGGQRWSIISSGSGNGEGPGKLIFFTSQSNSRKMMLDGSGNLSITGTFAQGSDRNAKTAFEPVNVMGILEQVAKLPVMKWAYTNDASVKHLGPMAQDFYAAFKVGLDDMHITTVDEGGVALAAIQGLNEKLNEKDAEIERFKEKAARVDSLEKRLAELEQVVQSLAKGK